MACGGGSKDSAGSSGATVAPVATATLVSSAGAEKPKPSPTPAVKTPPSPLNSGPAAGAEPVAFATSDGITISGNLFAAPGPKRRLLVIASNIPDTEAMWQDFARELAGAGVATMTFEMPEYKNTGVNRDLSLMDKDVETAVSFAESRDYPLIYVLGDQGAGIAALKVAARHKLAGVITVSAPLSLSGAPGTPAYDARAELPKITVPKLFLASNDTTASADANTLAQAAAPPKDVKIFNSGGPLLGAGLLRAPDAAGFKQAIKDFVTK